MKISRQKFGFIFLLALLGLSNASSSAQGIAFLEVSTERIDVVDFPEVKVTIGIWDHNGRIIRGFGKDNFVLREDNLETRIPYGVVITDEATYPAKSRAVNISFVVDIDPNLPNDKQKMIHNILCESIRSFATDKAKGILGENQVEIWTPGSGVTPIQSYSNDATLLCERVSKTSSPQSYQLTMNEILERLLSRQTDAAMEVIVIAVTRKVEQGIASSDDILRLRDNPRNISRPVYVLSFLDRSSGQNQLDREYLLRLSAYKEQGTRGFVDLDSAKDAQDAIELLKDISRQYQARYVLQYHSALRRSNVPHTLTIALEPMGVQSRPIKFIPDPRSGNLTYFPVIVLVALASCSLLFMLLAFSMLRSIPQYDYP